MGLFGHDDGGRKFVMREKLFSIGDDYWIEDEDGEQVFKVNGRRCAPARRSSSKTPTATR
jgi:uncharacterized protein YxjI